MYINSWKIDIYPILSLPIHNHVMVFIYLHLIYFLIFNIQKLIQFIRCIPKYFPFLRKICYNRYCISFLIFTCSLPVYRNAIDFLKKIHLVLCNISKIINSRNIFWVCSFYIVICKQQLFLPSNLYAFISLLIISCWLELLILC